MSDTGLKKKILHESKGINLLQVPEIDKTMLNKSDIAQTLCAGFPCEQHLPMRGTKLCGDAKVLL